MFVAGSFNSGRSRKIVHRRIKEMSYVSHCLIKLFVIFFLPSDSGNLSNLGAAIGNCVKRINKWSVQINKDKKKEREGESVNERIENLTK